jgi:hypothetical protein
MRVSIVEEHAIGPAVLSVFDRADESPARTSSGV